MRRQSSRNTGDGVPKTPPDGGPTPEGGLWVQPRRAEPLQSVTVRVPVELVRRIDDYCAFLGGTSDRSYVLREVATAYFARDRRFQSWLAERANSASGSFPAGTGGATPGAAVP